MQEYVDDAGIGEILEIQPHEIDRPEALLDAIVEFNRLKVAGGMSLLLQDANGNMPVATLIRVDERSNKQLLARAHSSHTLGAEPERRDRRGDNPTSMYDVLLERLISDTEVEYDHVNWQIREHEQFIRDHEDRERKREVAKKKQILIGLRKRSEQLQPRLEQAVEENRNIVDSLPLGAMLYYDRDGGRGVCPVQISEEDGHRRIQVLAERYNAGATGGIQTRGFNFKINSSNGSLLMPKGIRTSNEEMLFGEINGLNYKDIPQA